MKTLDNHVIIYDDECPMCDLYTRAFIRTKMLSTQGREAYSKLNEALSTQLDHARACNEIALVNTETGQVTYGIDSLFTVIGNRFNFFSPLFSLPAFRWIMKRIYSFISYNRKVIVPGKNFEGESTCIPSFNLKYRLLYLAFTWIITSLILHAYASTLHEFIPAGNFYRELAIAGAQLCFQGIFLWMVRKDRIMHYLGNMMTISMAGAFLLLPMLLTWKVAAVHTPIPALLWLALVVALMLLEHIRRVKILGLPWCVTLSWVVYRLLLLIILLVA